MRTAWKPRGSNSKITAAVDDENHVPVQVDDPAVILHDDLEVTEGALNTECPKVVIEYASPHKVEGDYTYEITTDGNVRILAYDGSEADVVVPATLGGPGRHGNRQLCKTCFCCKCGHPQHHVPGHSQRDERPPAVLWMRKP